MSARPRRLGAVLCSLAAVAVPALTPASAPAAVRVGENFALLPDRNPVHGRDALGLAVNPRNADHIVAVYADWASLWCEVAVSRNAGRSWRRTRLKAPAGFIGPPCTVGGHLSGQLDGSIAFGRGNTVYTTFSSGVVRQDGEIEGQSVLVAKSTDGGRRFSVGRVVMRGGPTGDVGPDYILPKVLVRPARSAAKKDRLYVVAGASAQKPGTTPPVSDEYTAMAVSADAGATWSDVRRVSPKDQNAIEHSQLTFGRKGALHISWRTRGRGQQPGKFVPEGTVVAAKSTDQGITWSATKTADVRGYVYEGPAQPPFTAGQSFTASTFPRMTSDPASGNLYLVYGDGHARRPGLASAADHFIHPDQDVYFQRSTDGGTTWSAPDRINGTPRASTEITQTRHPNIVVAPNGRVDVVWNDRRHWYRGCTHTHAACEEARLQDIYLRSSRDGGRSFGDEKRITQRSMNGDVGFDYRFGSYWDFGPVIVSRGADRSLVGWMDSRDGNPDTDSMGLYLAEVDFDAGGRIPTTVVPTRPREAFAIRLSQHAYPGGPEAVLAGTFASRPFSRVVIVNEKDAIGAMAGGVLARAHVGSVLVTKSGGLSQAVKDELGRLAPVGAYVIGGESSVSARVIADIAGTGVPADQIQRISSPGDAAGTAAQIAAAMDRRSPAAKREGRPAFNAVMLVNPASRDAMAATALAVNRRLPVLLTGRNSLPPSTAAALKSLGITRTLLVGSTGSIGAAVAAAVPGPQRLAGSSAHRTSRAIMSESIRRGVPDNVVYAVDARRRMEAALLGAAAGRVGGLLLLTERGGRTPARVLRDMKLDDSVDRVIHARTR